MSCIRVERKPNISHLRVFGCKCFVLNNGIILEIFMQNLVKVFFLVMLWMDMHIESIRGGF